MIVKGASRYCNYRSHSLANVRRLSPRDRLYYAGIIKVIFDNLEKKFKNFKTDDEITRKEKLRDDYEKKIKHAMGNEHPKKDEIRQVFEEEYEFFLNKNSCHIVDDFGILFKR